MDMKNITIAQAEVEWRSRLREVVADFDARGVGLRMAGNLTREELYDRRAARSEAGTASPQGSVRGRKATP